MDLATAYPYWVLGWLPPEAIPSIAVNELFAGRGSDAMAQLAGLSKPVRYQVDEILPRALQEVGLSLMSEQAAWQRLARDIASKIVDHSISPEDGAYYLYTLWWRADCPDLLRAFVGLDGELSMPEYGPGEDVTRRAVIKEEEKLLLSLQPSRSS